MTSQPSEPPRVILEATEHRCQAACSEAKRMFGAPRRPFLVRVSLNESAKAACLAKTGSAPEDSWVCTNMACGALFAGLKTLAPLQEIVK